jgi:FkbH-like protein
MQTFNQLKKNIKKDFSKFKTIKVAILGDTSTQLLVQALRGTGFNYDFDLKLWESDFDQIERLVFNTTSELYEFNPEIVILFHSTHKLLGKYNKLKPDGQMSFADNQLKLIDRIVSGIKGKLTSKIIYYNYPEINDSVFGSYTNKIESSFLFQLRKLNYELMIFAVDHLNFYICDLSTLQNQFGKNTIFQSSIYINTEMVLSLDILPELAAKTIDLIAAFYGKFKKCLIVDLDNTLWGGIIGDDGLENIQVGNLGIGKAFTEFQYWIKKLKNRGIIIAVCSKNFESIAKEPFEKHPDMVLKLEDIAVFVANWENKVDNIRQIQRILNIGFDSMVFLDDSAFERTIIRENIPEICVPELPEDPAEYLEYLYPLNLFETVSFSDKDADRTTNYQIEAQRNIIQDKFSNENDFLESLSMRSLVEPFNKFNIPRVAQLAQRSNQFNLRTIRYSESDIETLSISDDHFTFAFTLKDKLGDDGLISVVILEIAKAKTLFIESWFMSCRVLNRGMEIFVLNTIAGFANEKRFNFLIGEYLPTTKNSLVKDLYKNLGFIYQDNLWHLETTTFQNLMCYIKPITDMDPKASPGP